MGDRNDVRFGWNYRVFIVKQEFDRFQTHLPKLQGMKRPSICLLLLYALGWQSLCFSQTAIPPRMPLLFPQFEAFEAPNSQLIVGKLIPLGFSPDGKFAYVTEPPDEACGCYFFEFHIQDLETDRDLYKKRVEIDGTANIEWDRVWRQYRTTFLAQLDSHRIVLGKFQQQQQFPIEVDSTTLNLRIDCSTVLSDFGDDARFVAIAQVFLSSKDWGEKRVAKLNYFHGNVMSLKEGCYLKSPFEDRVVLILLRESRGWEGPPNPIEHVVIGARMKTRFPAAAPKTKQVSCQG
jgi:hypothetical protein